MNHDHARRTAASCSSCDLGDELEGTFGSTEVGHVQRGVTADNADESDIGEIQTFGDHLRTDEQVQFTALEFAEDALVIVTLTHGVAIHAGKFEVGEFAFEFFFDTLGA